MKLLLLLLPLLLSAKSYIVSSLPLPKTYILNQSIDECNVMCLDKSLKDGKIFSFLAQVEDNETENLAFFKEDIMIYNALFNLGGSQQAQSIKLAVILPSKKIGRYAYTISNSVFAYMLAENKNFNLKTFNIPDESKASLQTVLQEIHTLGYDYSIAALTQEGANNLIALNPQNYIYIPTVNKKSVQEYEGKKIYFGGIDYEKQINRLMKRSTNKVVIFNTQSKISALLNEYTQKAFENIHKDDDNLLIYPIGINKNTSSLKRKLKNNKKINLATFVLNTPVVKSGMILSQLTLYDVNTTNILSTQINYDPILFSMTQYNDRKQLYVANSITEDIRVVSDANTLLNNDIQYDWINYATTIGVDYFYYLMSLEPREYTLSFVNQQLQYPVEILRTNYSRFIRVE